MNTTFNLDPLKQTVRLNKLQTKLPNYSFRLLQILVLNAPNPISFEDIESGVWGAQVTRETIKQRVRLLRKTLAEIEAPDDAIEAVHNVGYRLTVKLQECDTTSIAAAPTPTLYRYIAATFVLTIFLSMIYLWLKPETSPINSSVRIAVLNELAISTHENVNIHKWLDANRLLSGQLSQLQGVDALATLSSDAIGSVRARDVAKDLSADMIVSSALVERNGKISMSYQLINGTTEEILWADEYLFTENNAIKAVPHFVKNVKMALVKNGLLHQNPSTDGSLQNTYFVALELGEVPNESNLRAAISILDSILEQDSSFTLARGLRARLTADLTIRHGVANIDGALRDARIAVAQEPTIAELKYALARAELASGDQRAALRHLREVVRYLPYVERDINVLEKQVSDTHE